MNKAVAVSNQKGGVGKTTTVINLAYELSQAGKKVLVVDCDPQTNCQSGLGVAVKKDNHLYALLSGSCTAEAAVYKTNFPNLDLLPASSALSGAQVELVAATQREQQLKKALQPLKQLYDYFLIDTPPSLSLLTLNAFVAAASVLIPIQCEYYALEGISGLLKTIKRVKEGLNRQLTVEGVLLTMFDARTNLAHEVAENLRAHFKEKTYKTVIARNVKISEAPSFGKPVGAYAKESSGAQHYRALAQEFLRQNSKTF